MAGDRVLNLTDAYCGPRQSSMRIPGNISWQYKLFLDPFYVNIVRQAIPYDGFEVHTAVIMKSTDFWALIPCSSETDKYQVCPLLRLVSVWFTIRPWIWSQNVPPKRRNLPNYMALNPRRPHSSIYRLAILQLEQKTEDRITLLVTSSRFIIANADKIVTVHSYSKE